MNNTVKFDAKIEKIYYFNQDNNYHIMYFSTDTPLKDAKIGYKSYYSTLVGNCVKCEEGDRVKVEAELVDNIKYGKQYKIISLGFDKPDTPNEVYTFLSMILTPNQADELCRVYPNIVDDVIENNDFVPDYSKLRGIGEKTWCKIREKIVSSFCLKDLITLLSPIGVTLTMIQNIGRHFGTQNSNLLKEKIFQNPYILCEVSRLSFKKVDRYALNLNPNIIHSEFRVRSCVEYLLTKEAEENGHSYIKMSEFMDLFKELISDKDIIPVLKNFLIGQQAKCMNSTPDLLYINDDNIGLVMFYRMEAYIKDKLMKLALTDNIWSISYADFCKRMQTTTDKQGFYLSDEQTEVVRSICEKNVTILSGKAGCVDCDTEYFNGTEWKKIADYQEGDKVLSYNIDTKEAVLDYPLDYIKQKSNYLWHFYNEEINLDQVLCEQHIILDYKGEKIQVSNWLNNPKAIHIPSSFYYKYENKDIFNNVIIQNFIPSNCNPIQYKTKDGYKYCFTMPLKTLILRRNNKIFITHNCGKTSVIKAILEVYKNKSIAMAALSAKAAKRMTEVTEKSSSTIHRLLGYDVSNNFLYNEDNHLPYDLLIIDECSMNNIWLFYSLLKAVGEKTKVIFCGDFAQVPSIGVGAVFTDLINTNIFNNHILTKVYRQSEEAYIVEHANIVREGVMPFDITTGNMPFGQDTIYFFRKDSEDIHTLVVSIFLKFLKEGTSVEDISIVVPRKDTVLISCEQINNAIQDELFDENVISISNNTKTFKKGARIINKKNDYQKGVLNGDMGTIVKINSEQKKFTVSFDDNNKEVEFSSGEMNNIELGYALTVHSAQGSQYKVCIVALDMSSYTLLSANMIYTAMTRAVDKLIVVSQPSAFIKSVTNMKEHNRQTWLKNLLTEDNKREILLGERKNVQNRYFDVKDGNILLEKPLDLSNDKDWGWGEEPLPF